tara:strand:+ start:2523 stop:2996 length:474 start_codon:yes stop_codon:yes gene_type:complete
MTKLNHLDSSGNAIMIDVRNKATSHRVAIATGKILMKPETCRLIKESAIKKGDVIASARIAGIMASKKTAELIPLCHPLNITKIEIGFELEDLEGTLTAIARVETEGKTGVEIEAINAVQVCLLTVYDMCKAVDRGMTIENVGLLKKSGGNSGEWQR